MTGSRWTWPGARWWRCDLHTHTPASTDYGKGPAQAELKQTSPRDWLLDYMRAGIDCVGVTDHNCGAWIDRLIGALQELEGEQPEGYRPLFLFPGVEISISGGVHLLALFSPEKTSVDISNLLGAVGFTAEGDCNSVSTKTFAEAVEITSKREGIAIPAHVDGANGLFRQLSGADLRQALACPSILAMEVTEPSAA